MSNATHYFIDADKPAHPMSLPLDTAFEVIKTDVRVVGRGLRTADDVVEFTHYVKREHIGTRRACLTCGAASGRLSYCDLHRYSPCLTCGRSMRRVGQRAADHPGTVPRNSKTTCGTCHERSRRGGVYTGDVAEVNPDHLRIVSEMVNERFVGNDRDVVAGALGVALDTQASVH